MKKRANELNIIKNHYKRGKFNAITDVEGIKVGHITLIKGKDVRTGVSVVLPPIDPSKNSLIAGGYVFNGNGEVTGLHYIMEKAKLNGPIFLTNTLSLGDVFSAVVEYYKGKIVLPVIGECWDGYLNDIEGRYVKKKHVFSCIKNAKSGKVEEGCVGAGTGMISLGFKAGIGTSSRIVNLNGKKYTIGVLVNNNLGSFSKYLRMGKFLIGESIQGISNKNMNEDSKQSSIIIIIATDIPLTHNQLNRLSKHAVLGMARLGAVSFTGSGDFVIAFSTANKIPRKREVVSLEIECIHEGFLDDAFEAVIESTEE
ncbi:MAG: P1 family peptidase, partial [Candidatus Aenigmarchaeota archaeon]|nr:P1 family peptidase [Candidatus Aenigmarchaeota archaeon]